MNLIHVCCMMYINIFRVQILDALWLQLTPTEDSVSVTGV